MSDLASAVAELEQAAAAVVAATDALIAAKRRYRDAHEKANVEVFLARLRES